MNIQEFSGAKTIISDLQRCEEKCHMSDESSFTIVTQQVAKHVCGINRESGTSLNDRPLQWGDPVALFCSIWITTNQYQVVLSGSLYLVVKHFYPNGSCLQNESMYENYMIYRVWSPDISPVEQLWEILDAHNMLENALHRYHVTPNEDICLER